MRAGPLLLTAILLAAAHCRADELVFAIPAGSALPITDFHYGVLTGGLQKEFSDALARELRLAPRYLIAPRKRVEHELAAGHADLLCGLRPEWLDGKDWLWSVPVFTNEMIIVSRSDTPPLTQLSSLANQRIGTILGYRYPELEAALGARFLRDDAASDDLNLAKLLRHRFAYMATVSQYFDYQRKIHPQRGNLNTATFRVMTFDTLCALPPHGKLTLEQLNAAIGTLRKRGDMQAIADHFRPASP